MNPSGSPIPCFLSNQPGHFSDRTGAGHENQQSSGQNPNAAQVYRTMDNHNVSYSTQPVANSAPDMGLVASNLGAPFVPTISQMLEAFFMIGQKLFNNFQDQSCANIANLGFVNQNPIPNRIETKMYTADEVQACLDHQSETFRKNFLSLLGKMSVNTEPAQVGNSVSNDYFYNNLETKSDCKVTSSPQYKTGNVNLVHCDSQSGTWTIDDKSLKSAIAQIANSLREQLKPLIDQRQAQETDNQRSHGKPKKQKLCNWCGESGHIYVHCYQWNNFQPPTSGKWFIKKEWKHRQRTFPKEVSKARYLAESVKQKESKYYYTLSESDRDLANKVYQHRVGWNV